MLNAVAIGHGGFFPSDSSDPATVKLQSNPMRRKTPTAVNGVETSKPQNVAVVTGDESLESGSVDEVAAVPAFKASLPDVVGVNTTSAVAKPVVRNVTLIGSWQVGPPLMLKPKSRRRSEEGQREVNRYTQRGSEIDILSTDTSVRVGSICIEV